MSWYNLQTMTTQTQEPRSKQWTRDEYYRLAEEGYFRGKHVQLVEGEIIQMPPMKHPHALCVMKADTWLRTIFSQPQFLIRIQMPMNALENSDPEPDFAILSGPLEAMTDHPTTALLIIEVSDTSVRLDRRKASLYAAAGVPEYWIINIPKRCIELFRDPIPDESAEFGFRYAQASSLEESASLSPLSMPVATVKVSDLLP